MAISIAKINNLELKKEDINFTYLFKVVKIDE